MKKLFSLIALLGMCVSGAWAQTTVLYERGTTNNWTDADLSDWSVTDNNQLTFSINNGIYLTNTAPTTNKISYQSSKTVATTTNAKISIQATIAMGGATGRSGSYEYLTIGDVSFRGYGQDNKGVIVVNGVETVVSGHSRGCTWTIDMTYNQATGTVSGTAKVGTTNNTISGTISNDISNVTIGHYRAGTENYASPITLSKISISEELQSDPVCSATLNAVDENDVVIKTLASSNFMKSEGYTTYAPKAFVKDGVCYVTNTTAFKQTFTTTETKTIKYVATPNTVVYEETDLAVSRAYAATTEKDFFSNGKGARLYASSYATTPALEGGVYTLVVAGCVNTRTPTFAYGYRLNGENVMLGETETFSNGSYESHKTVENIVIPKGASFCAIENTGYNNNLFIDYIMLTKTGVVSTMSEAGYTTFSSTYNVDADAIEGGKAYVINAFNAENVVLTPASGIVPANTGMIIAGEGGAAASAGTVTIPVSTADATFDTSSNLLVACATATTVQAAAAGKKNYVLAYDADDAASTIGFYYIGSTSATVAAGKAYLTVDEATPAKMFRFSTGNTTGIKAVSNEITANKAVKRIMNGQLVIEKAGKMFNAAGAEVK